MPDPMQRQARANQVLDDALNRVGITGRIEPDTSISLEVPDRPGYIFVRLGVEEPTGIIEARNQHVPLKVNTRVVVRKELDNHWSVVGLDFQSGLLLANDFNVHYHHHGPGSGLGRENDAALIYRGNTFQVPDDSVTNLNFNTIRVDTNAYFDMIANPDRLVISETGWYLVVANIVFEHNPTGHRSLTLRRSTGRALAYDVRPAIAESPVPTSLTAVSIDFYLGASWVACELYQNSGGDLNVISEEGMWSYFSIVRVG